MNSRIDGKTPNTITPAVKAKIAAGVPMHQAVAGASAKPTGPRVKV